MKVFGARCIVKEEKRETNKTSSGIIVPGSDKEPTFTGTVIAVGDGALLDSGIRVPMEVKVGDRIVYTNFSGTPIINKGETYLVLNERDILAIID